MDSMSTKKAYDLFDSTKPANPVLPRAWTPSESESKPGLRFHDLKFMREGVFSRVERIPIIKSWVTVKGTLILRTDVLDEKEQNIHIFVYHYSGNFSPDFEKILMINREGLVADIDLYVTRKRSRDSRYSSTYTASIGDAAPRIRGSRRLPENSSGQPSCHALNRRTVEGSI